MSEQSTAIHEAGHAVIGRVLGLLCGEATIIPDEEDAEIIAGDVYYSGGYAINHGPWATIRGWDQVVEEDYRRGVRPKCRPDGAAFRAAIIMIMAGAEAQQEFGHPDVGTDWHDRREIEIVASDRAAGFVDHDLWERCEPRLRRQARRLVRKHRDKIEHVAASLLERKTLTAEEIDHLFAVGK